MDDVKNLGAKLQLFFDFYAIFFFCYVSLLKIFNIDFISILANMNLRTTFIIFQALLIPLLALAYQSDDRSESELRSQLRRLDRELEKRDTYLEQRRRSIDSLAVIASDSTMTPAQRAEAMLSLGNALNSYDVGWALSTYSAGQALTQEYDLPLFNETFRLRMATFLPLAGYYEDAIARYNSVDTTGMSPSRKIEYYDTGRQMYSYIASYNSTQSADSVNYINYARDAQIKMLPLLDPASKKYRLNLGEHYFLKNEYVKAEAVLSDLITDLDEDDNTYARASHIISDIAAARDRPNDHLYFLTLSAIADTKAATREIASLQELGNALFRYDDIERARHYLSIALKNAVECNASLRMIQSAQSIPIIEQAHQTQLRQSRLMINFIIGLLAVFLVLLMFTLWMLYKKNIRMNGLTDKLGDANKVKDIYINEFLNLCSVYIEKLHSVSNLVQRKLSTGKADDLMQLTKSGKLVEEQSGDFYSVFDEAFLNLYPHFVESVNALLRHDEQIDDYEKGRLNTDLRILALMRLGMNETSRIARLLNYSVHTIYAYRNKLRNRSINRDTFDDDIMQIPSISDEAGELK